MKQQILRTMIVLSGQVDNTFGKLGSALTNLGSQLGALSNQVIKFGQESLESYAGYDDTMRYVQGLGELGEKTRKELDEYNRTIAQTSRYTMDQAAQAEMLMAQMGLGVEEIKTLMPTVMDTATAANIDLSDSLNYLYYSLNALNMPMSDVSVLSDQMAKTASISAADINTLGLSLQRLGSGAQFFAGGSSEILAILGGISKFGEDMQGREAGTQLRNFMLTLLAPTKSKDKIMAELGVTEEAWAEFESYMDDAEINVTDTAKAMNELGLTIYDQATGKLKPAIQIVGELSAALRSLENDDQRNKVLGDLFGKRTTTTAQNLIASLETIIAYQKEIEERSKGYTEYMARLADGGIGGTIRRAQAAWGALENRVGGVLAPDVSDALEGFTGIVNSITNLDDGKMELLVGAAEGIASAGPSLLLAGGALRLIGSLLTPGGLVATGVLTLAALKTSLDALYDYNFDEKFGSLELDKAGLKSYIDTLGSSAKEAYEKVTAYNEAVDKALSAYETASTTLKAGLVERMLTGATLSEEDVKSLNGLGQSMIDAVTDGIKYNHDALSEGWLQAFGGDEEEAKKNPLWQEVQRLIGDSYEESIAKAESLGQQLKGALKSATEDLYISDEELQNIQSYFDQLNEVMAEQARIQQYQTEERLLRKAQTMGLNDLNELSNMASEAMAANLEPMYLEQDKLISDARVQLEKEVAQGITTQAHADEVLAGMRAQFREEEARRKLDALPLIQRLYENAIGGSDLADEWQTLRDVAGKALSKGMLTDEDYSAYISGMSNFEQRQMRDLLSWYVDALGGEDGILSQIDALMSETGKTAEQLARDQQSAGYLRNLLTMYGIGTRGQYGYSGEIGNMDAAAQGYDVEAARRQMQALDRDDAMATIADYMMQAIETGSAADFERFVLGGALGAPVAETLSGLDSVVEQLKGLPDFSGITVPDGLESIGDYYRAFAMLGGYADMQSGTAQMEVEFPDNTEKQEAFTEKAQSFFDGHPIIPNIPLPDGAGWVNDFYTSAIAALEGREPIRLPFGGGAGSQGNTAQEFAEGGRADAPSIFGEAGPEWAVPEEHTQRTARLLDQARQASGFTWPELIARNGGLNAGEGTRTQLVYSPTIIVRDARGVEQALAEDKQRLDRWWEERQMMERMEAFS